MLTRCALGESNLCDTNKVTKQKQQVKDRGNHKDGHGDVSRSSFPRKVRLRWRSVEPPRHSNSTDVLTLFSVSFSREG